MHVIRGSDAIFSNLSFRFFQNLILHYKVLVLQLTLCSISLLIVIKETLSYLVLDEMTETPKSERDLCQLSTVIMGVIRRSCVLFSFCDVSGGL